MWGFYLIVIAQRLVRFVSDDGQTYYGDAILDDGEADIARARHARVIEGDIFGDHEVTDTCLVICQLLMPLEPADVGTVRCIGLNYGGHAEETQMKKPKYPLLFYKPRTALAGPSDDIIVPQMAQESPEVDYECELVIVTGKECRNVSEADALSHVLGYAVGNDVTHRDWQLKRGEGQWSHGKGFDTWGPFGPGIVTGQVIKDPQTLAISTAVNGNTLQVRGDAVDDLSDALFGD